MLAGVQSLATGSGLGHMSPNTVMFGHRRASGDEDEGARGCGAGRDRLPSEVYADCVRVCLFFGHNVLVARGFQRCRWHVPRPSPACPPARLPA